MKTCETYLSEIKARLAKCHQYNPHQLAMDIEFLEGTVDDDTLDLLEFARADLETLVKMVEWAQEALEWEAVHDSAAAKEALAILDRLAGEVK